MFNVFMLRLRQPIVGVIFGAVMVAMSSMVLPSVKGYGTVLFQLVAFSGYVLVAIASSQSFAEQNMAIVWTISAMLNVLYFVIPGWIIYRFSREKWQTRSAVLIWCWLLFYLASLLYLFPATDGP
jgi:hypothetical protein